MVKDIIPATHMFLLQEFQKELLTVQSDFGIGSDTLSGYLLFFIPGVQVCWKGGKLLPLSIQYKISEIHYRSFPGQTAKLGKLLICCFKSWFIRQWLVLSALLGSVSFFYGSQGPSIFNDPCDTDSVDILLLVCNTAEKFSVGNIKAWCVSHA